MKTKNIFDLDPERLATTDEDGHRVYLYPEDVKGKWKNRRTIVYWFLILFYLVLPWFYIKGKPALKFDLVNNQLTFLGFTFYGVEPILMFLVVASALFLIASMTSLFGRVWCGWACPQTVFIQSIFMKIETLIEGKARVRRERAKGPMTFDRSWKLLLKWGIFTAISLHIAHTFLGYFIGPRELLQISMGPPTEHPTLFFLTMASTAIILFDFGWFREQFCIVACPYGRLQSVMMDENSLVVSYDKKRDSDCINCYKCVKVCPTGIDIRRGTQLECIACTLCIDACDEIMVKVKRPEGLIRYGSENEMNGGTRKLVTPRSVIYAIISLCLFGLFGLFLSRATNINLMFIRNKVPFMKAATERELVNHFTLKITHQGERQYHLRFQVKNPELAGKVRIVTPSVPTIVTGHDKKIVLFFRFSPEVLINGSRKIEIEALDDISQETVALKEVVLVGSTY